MTALTLVTITDWTTAQPLNYPTTVIADNTGTGLAVIGSAVQAWHTTLAGNGAVGLTAQTSGQGPASVMLTNTIIAGPGVGVQIVGHPFSASSVDLSATLWHNLTDTEIGAGGHITRARDFAGDPAFAGVDDYRLTAASPARNRGVPAGVAFDIIGVRRDPLPDLGAYEYDDPSSIRQVYLPLVRR